MSQLDNIRLAGLNKLISLNPATFTYNGSSITVYASSFRDTNTSIDSTGMSFDYDNLYIMGKTSEIGSWGLVPMVSRVSLNGINYMVGQSITVNGPSTTVWLRKRR